MIMLNVVDHGLDDSTLESIIKSAPTAKLDDLLRSCGFDVEMVQDNPAPEEYEPLGKSEILDLLKARKIKTHTTVNAKGKTVQKVRKRILCHNAKTGKEFFQMRTVNADVAEDAKLEKNPLKAFDEHVARVRRETTQHLTEEAANITDMMSTQEGRAALDAINAAIGSATRNGKLTKNLNYTNIRYCKDPVKAYDDDGNAEYYGCVAIAKNPKTGKDMYFYSQQFQEAAAAERAQRAMVLASPNGRAWVEQTLDSGEFESEDVRDCLKLMYSYGMKSGNEMGSRKNQLGDYSTVGATTLTAGNIFLGKKRVKDPQTGHEVTVERVYLQFYQQGEKGSGDHQQSIEIKDPQLAQNLKLKKAQASGDDDRIFSCTKDDTLAVCKELFGCNNEDLRSAFGFMKWQEGRRAVLGTNPYSPKRTERVNPATGKKEKLTPKRAEMEIAEYIMEQMGVTDKRSVSGFINKNLVKLYQTKPKELAQKQKAQKQKAQKQKVKQDAGKNPRSPKPKGTGPKTPAGA